MSAAAPVTERNSALATLNYIIKDSIFSLFRQASTLCRSMAGSAQARGRQLGRLHYSDTDRGNVQVTVDSGKLDLCPGVRIILLEFDGPGTRKIFVYSRMAWAADSTKRESQVGGTWLPKRET